MEEIKVLNLQGFVEYNVLPLRSPAHMVDPAIAPPPPADDYADGSWTEWLDTPALKTSQYMMQVVDTFRAHAIVTWHPVFARFIVVVVEALAPLLGPTSFA